MSFERIATQVRQHGVGRLVMIALVVAASVLAGFVLGTKSAESANWGTGRAHALDSGLVGIEGDDWTYGFTGEVWWIDETGAWHEGSWPSCLPVGEEVTVRFAAVPVSIDGLNWREVVALDCR
jgi:hypothetical protein